VKIMAQILESTGRGGGEVERRTSQMNVLEIFHPAQFRGRRKHEPKTATAPYFYGSILLRALKSEIIVLVRYHCGGWSEELNSHILLLAYMVYL
jgi:hypothetical protein